MIESARISRNFRTGHMSANGRFLPLGSTSFERIEWPKMLIVDLRRFRGNILEFTSRITHKMAVARWGGLPQGLRIARWGGLYRSRLQLADSRQSWQRLSRVLSNCCARKSRHSEVGCEKFLLDGGHHPGEIKSVAVCTVGSELSKLYPVQVLDSVSQQCLQGYRIKR
jgi:hypothetical protein